MPAPPYNFGVVPYMLTENAVGPLRQAFGSTGYVKIPGLFDLDFFTLIREEVRQIEHLKSRRDFRMPAFDTPRRMATIGGKAITQHSQLLPHLYRSRPLHDFVESVAGEPIFRCTHRTEFLVKNILEQEGDTHGWHLDDPDLALVLVIDAPAADDGGLLEYVPAWARYDAWARTIGLEAATERLRTCGGVNTLHHGPGDAYLLRARDHLHRVTPLRARDTRRVVLSCAFSTTEEQEYGVTASLLYD